MTTDALLAAIRADPDVDLPRLVYADHLDDTGQPERAEFIRVQCELARLSEWDDRRPALEDREHELLDRHEPTWLDVTSGEVVEWQWWRGFLGRLDVRDLFAPLDDLTAAHPITEVGCSPDTVIDPADLPARCRSWLAGVRSLDLSAGSWAAAEEYAAVFADDLLPALCGLDLTGPGYGEGLYALLSRSPVARRLDRLRVDDVELSGGDCARLFGDAPLTELRLTDDVTGYGLDRLLDCPFATRLVALDLADNPLDLDDGRVFGRLPADTPLARLDVSGTDLGRFDLDRLLGHPGLGRLTELGASRGGGWVRRYESLAATDFWGHAERVSLGSCEISADALQPLSRTAGSSGLRHLDLGNNDLGSAGIEHLLDARWGASLNWLALNGNRIGDASVAAFADAGKFTALRTLHLGNNRLTDASALALAASSSLSRLRLLTLTAARLSHRAIDALLNAPHWLLFGLGLSDCDLSAPAVEMLARSPRLRRLQWLDLSRNPWLRGDTLLPLAQSPHLSRLCELDVAGLDLSDRVRAVLYTRLGRRLSD